MNALDPASAGRARGEHDRRARRDFRRARPAGAAVPYAGASPRSRSRGRLDAGRRDWRSARTRSAPCAGASATAQAAAADRLAHRHGGRCRQIRWPARRHRRHPGGGAFRARRSEAAIRHRRARLRRRGGLALSRDADVVVGLCRRIRERSACERPTPKASRSPMRCGPTEKIRTTFPLPPTGRDDAAGYIEVHIEQGPVLESQGRAARHRHRHRRPGQAPRHRDRRGRARRHRADESAPRCLCRRGRDGAGAGKDRPRASRGRHGRHRRPHRGGAGRSQHHSRPRVVHRRSAVAHRCVARRSHRTFRGRGGAHRQGARPHGVASSRSTRSRPRIARRRCRMRWRRASPTSATRRSGCRPAPATTPR